MSDLNSRATDPKTIAEYLALPKFHKSVSFRRSSGQLETATYADVGSSDGPIVVWVNGMGSYRSAAGMCDSLAKERGYRLITVDKAGVKDDQGTLHGRNVQPNDRIPWMLDALTAVLDDLHIQRFSLWSHSNGFIYSIFIIKNLPTRFHVDRYVATAPWVPPSISGSLAFSAAGLLPDGVIRSAPHLFQALNPIASLLGSSFGRSAGLASSALAWSSGVVSSKPGSTKENSKPKEAWMSKYISPEFEKTFIRSAANANHSIAAEAIFCLKGLPTSCWGYTVPNSQDDETSMRRLLDGTLRTRPDLPIQIVFGADDSFIPKKGRQWLKDEMRNQRLVTQESQWIEVNNAGHDSVIGRLKTIDAIFPK